MTVADIHTSLTVEDVDKIHECQRRLLNAAVLLELGLYRLLDGAEVPFDPEAIQQALLDVVQYLREDATQIGVTVELAGKAKLAGGRRPAPLTAVPDPVA
jgi:hypothetical protein